MSNNLEKKNSQNIFKRKRSLTRLLAVQIFYQFEFFTSKTPISEIKNSTIENYVFDEKDQPKSCRSKIDEQFLDNLINALILEKENIDQEIFALAKNNFSTQKDAQLIQQILRLATLELKLSQDIAFKIIINEYVEIAANFFENSRTNFVNSILENLAKKFRPSEFKNFIKNKNE